MAELNSMMAPEFIDKSFYAKASTAFMTVWFAGHSVIYSLLSQRAPKYYAESFLAESLFFAGLSVAVLRTNIKFNLDPQAAWKNLKIISRETAVALGTTLPEKAKNWENGITAFLEKMRGGPLVTEDYGKSGPFNWQEHKPGETGFE